MVYCMSKLCQVQPIGPYKLGLKRYNQMIKWIRVGYNFHEKNAFGKFSRCVRGRRPSEAARRAAGGYLPRDQAFSKFIFFEPPMAFGPILWGTMLFRMQQNILSHALCTKFPSAYADGNLTEKQLPKNLFRWIPKRASIFGLFFPASVCACRRGLWGSSTP